MNSKKKYIAPQLRVDKYEVEAGFAISLAHYLEDDPNALYYDNGQERWGWNGNDDDNSFGGSSWGWND